MRSNVLLLWQHTRARDPEGKSKAFMEIVWAGWIGNIEGDQLQAAFSLDHDLARAQTGEQKLNAQMYTRSGRPTTTALCSNIQLPGDIVTRLRGFYHHRDLLPLFCCCSWN